MIKKFNILLTSIVMILCISPSLSFANVSCNINSKQPVKINNSIPYISKNIDYVYTHKFNEYQLFKISLKPIKNKKTIVKIRIKNDGKSSFKAIIIAPIIKTKKTIKPGKSYTEKLKLSKFNNSINIYAPKKRVKGSISIWGLLL